MYGFACQFQIAYSHKERHNKKKMVINTLVKTLQQKGVRFEDGLSDKEIIHIEQLYYLLFPPDLRVLLQYAFP